MKRGASGEPQGAQQRSEKAVKQGDAEPELARADPLLVFLQELSAEDANEWHAVLLERRVRSLDDLVGLAQDPGWEGFLNKLRNADQDVLASKLNAWRQGLGLREPSGGDSPDKKCRYRSALCSFASFVLFHSLFWPPRHPLVGGRSVCVSSLDASWRRSGMLE
jgi:hypothetical protein